MFVFPRRLVVGDVSVIHPASGSCARAAARLPGWAAARRNAAKERAYWHVSSGLPFVPLSVESFGRLGALALSLLRSLADQAVQAGGSGLSRDAFIFGVLWELAVALCRGSASLRWSGLYHLTLISSRAPLRGLSCPRPRWSENVRGCLFGSRLGCHVLECLDPVWLLSRASVACVACVCSSLASTSSPFGAHAVRRAPRPSL
jgi:hypothetical protein